MPDAITIILSIMNSIYTFKTRFSGLAKRLKTGVLVPFNYSDLDSRPPAIVVNFSHDTKRDVTLAGYCIVGEIGVPKQLKPSEITQWSEGAAVLIHKVGKSVGGHSLAVVLACPVSAAFIIGSMLGHSTEYRILHWDGSGYTLLDIPDMNRFRRSL